MTKSERFDIHQHITDQIVAAIDRGAGEFRLPWQRRNDIILVVARLRNASASTG